MLPLAVTGEYRWLCAIHKASWTLPHRRWRAGMDLRVSRKLCPCLPVGDSLGYYRDNCLRLSSVPVQRKNPADTCCFDADHVSLSLAVSLLWLLLLIVQSFCCSFMLLWLLNLRWWNIGLFTDEIQYSKVRKKPSAAPQGRICRLSQPISPITAFPTFCRNTLWRSHSDALPCTWDGRKGKAPPAGQGQWPYRISNRLQSGGTGSTISWPYRDISTT